MMTKDEGKRKYMVRGKKGSVAGEREMLQGEPDKN